MAEKQKQKLAQGHSVVHIYPRYLGEVVLPWPKKEEQKEIASLLLKANKEVKLLEKELEYLKEQKKGLMQLLLTGKVRVKC